MWTRIIDRGDRAYLRNGKERWQNTHIDDFMAFRLGAPTPGPDGQLQGWRMWEDDKRILCEREETAAVAPPSQRRRSA